MVGATLRTFKADRGWEWGQECGRTRAGTSPAATLTASPACGLLQAVTRAPVVPPRVVYRAMPPLALTGLVLVFIAASLAFEGFAVVMLRRVSLVCSRAAGTCTISPSVPVIGQARVVPLATIRHARLDVDRSGRHAHYSVLLVTDEGEVPLSNLSTGDREGRVESQTAIEAYLADKTAERLDVEYDTANPLAVIFVLCGLTSLVVARGFLGAVRLEVDARQGVLTVTRTAWPSRDRSREVYPLASVRAVTVDRYIQKKAPRFVAALVVDGQEGPVRLLADGSGDELWHEQAAAKIRALLSGAG